MLFILWSQLVVEIPLPIVCLSNNTIIPCPSEFFWCFQSVLKSIEYLLLYLFNLVSCTIFDLKGHNKAIMALAVTEDGESVFSASYDGLICIFYTFWMVLLVIVVQYQH